MSGISDPKLFKEMCVPHESVDEAQAAWEGFWKDVYEARKKHRIAQVAMVADIRVNIEGEPISFIPASSIGNTGEALYLLARGLGALRKQEQDKLDQLSRGEKLESATPKPKRRKS